MCCRFAPREESQIGLRFGVIQKAISIDWQVRLVLLDWEEWMGAHQNFCRENGYPATAPQPFSNFDESVGCKWTDKLHEQLDCADVSVVARLVLRFLFDKAMPLGVITQREQLLRSGASLLGLLPSGTLAESADKNWVGVVSAGL